MERNYLPWAVALDAFKIILDLLEPKDTDSNIGERKEVFDWFKTWLINLMMPYFCENGYADASDATEEQNDLKKKMRKYSCEQLEHKPCLNSESKLESSPMEPIGDEEYCKKMLLKIVNQVDVDIDVALNVLERCPDQVIASPDEEQFMAKVTSRLATGEEVRRLNKWENKLRFRDSGKGNALKQAQSEMMMEQVYIKKQARKKCREMVFQAIRKFGGKGTLKDPRGPKEIENIFH